MPISITQKEIERLRQFLGEDITIYCAHCCLAIDDAKQEYELSYSHVSWGGKLQSADVSGIIINGGERNPFFWHNSWRGEKGEERHGYDVIILIYRNPYFSSQPLPLWDPESIINFKHILEVGKDHLLYHKFIEEVCLRVTKEGLMNLFSKIIPDGMQQRIKEYKCRALSDSTLDLR